MQTVKQIQDAIDGGRFVLAPIKRVPTAPPLHNRDELTAALCLMLKLSRTEGVVLTNLTVQGYIAKKEIGAITDQKITGNAVPGAVRVFIHTLRKKLPRGIASQIITIPAFGYAFRSAGREKVLGLLAKHAIQPKSKTLGPNLLDART
jgi:hypothetical protein